MFPKLYTHAHTPRDLTPPASCTHRLHLCHLYLFSNRRSSPLGSPLVEYVDPHHSVDSMFVNLPTRYDLLVTPKSVFTALSESFTDQPREAKKRES